jgi:hypothetical protein
MVRSGMSWAWGLPACVALAALPVSGAGAQGQQQYETPLYTTQAPATLDPNYGLPTYGMPNLELPRQATAAPAKEAPVEPNFLKGFSKARNSASASGMETPLFTTSDGSTTSGTASLPGDADTTSGDTLSSAKATAR